MKKIAVYILITVIIVAFIAYLYLNFTILNNRAKRENMEFEEYIKNDITGTEMATLINKTIDKNEVNKVEKDEKGNYIDNNKDSILIHIKFIDSENIFTMEQIKKGGIDEFLQNYNTVEFKCMKENFHSKTSKISYLYFEEKPKYG